MDREGSSTDGEAPGVNPEYTNKHGSHWAFTLSFYGGALHVVYWDTPGALTVC